MKRTHYTALGREDNQDDNSLTETDANIFDDGDFYHQLLKDLIERKTSSTTDEAQVNEIRDLRGEEMPNKLMYLPNNDT